MSRKAGSFKAVRDKYKQNKVIVLTFDNSFVIVISYYCKFIDLKSFSGTVKMCGKPAFIARDTKSLL